MPNREYFFNIMNSICGEYVAELIKHANLQRNSIAREDQQTQAIYMSEDWFNKLNEQPFISGKST